MSEKTEVHQKMREAVKAEMAKDEELEQEVDLEQNDQDTELEAADEQDYSQGPEYTETELEAMDLGWKPEGKDKDGNTLSADEFLSRRPLFNKIKNQREELDEIKRLVAELREDNKKIAQASIKEKQELLQELKEAREKALDDLDADEVRNLDKRIENVQEEITTKPDEKDDKTEYVSPHWNGFLEKNEWAGDPNSALYHAGMGMARRYLLDHPEHAEPGKDGPMYDYVHKKIREEFPEKFKDAPKQGSGNKVSSSNKRATGSYSKKKQVTLADLPEEEREVVRVMMRATGKTEAEYLKNYEL